MTKLPFTDEELTHSRGHNSWTQFIPGFTFGSLNSNHKPLLEKEEGKKAVDQRMPRVHHQATLLGKKKKMILKVF